MTYDHILATVRAWDDTLSEADGTGGEYGVRLNDEDLDRLVRMLVEMAESPAC